MSLCNSVVADKNILAATITTVPVLQKIPEFQNTFNYNTNI
jgi:hypothetical protein